MIGVNKEGIILSKTDLEFENEEVLNPARVIAWLPNALFFCDSLCLSGLLAELLTQNMKDEK